LALIGSLARTLSRTGACTLILPRALALRLSLSLSPALTFSPSAYFRCLLDDPGARAQADGVRVAGFGLDCVVIGGNLGDRS
jgi:hypothetical protein